MFERTGRVRALVVVLGVVFAASLSASCDPHGGFGYGVHVTVEPSALPGSASEYPVGVLVQISDELLAPKHPVVLVFCGPDEPAEMFWFGHENGGGSCPLGQLSATAWLAPVEAMPGVDASECNPDFFRMVSQNPDRTVQDGPPAEAVQDSGAWNIEGAADSDVCGPTLDLVLQ